MAEQVFAVRAQDYECEVGATGFLGLPREEIERLHATIDVLTVTEAEAASGTYLALLGFTALHYNYAWLTHDVGEQRSLGIATPLRAATEAPLFLDDAFQTIVQSEVERESALAASCSWRLAGLIRDGLQLGLVFVARMRQRGGEHRPNAQASFRFCGHGDLVGERAHFDTWSQLLIDNLHAL